jgi:DNA-binding PadR family transcriptional regulator
MKRFSPDPEPLGQPALHVLLALGGESKHGYAIMQDIAEESGGVIRLLPGTLYSTIKKLLAEGLIAEVEAPPEMDARRRYYRVTRRGRQAAEAEMRRMALLVRLGRGFLSS